ncbi:MAG: hypothetical protein ACTHKL_02170 [Streptosporangiaceae bacterium]
MSSNRDAKGICASDSIPGAQNSHACGAISGVVQQCGLADSRLAYERERRAGARPCTVQGLLDF